MMQQLSDLFDVRYGHSLELVRMKQTAPDKGLAFVSRTAKNNGVSAFVEPLEAVEPGKPGEITVALGGSVLSTFLQTRPFYTGYHVAILKPRHTLNRAELLYYCAAISANRYRYSYGRQANRSLASLRLPALSEIPGFVDDHLVEKLDGIDRTYGNHPTPDLATSGWMKHTLGELFDIAKGKRLTKANMIPGDIPFVGASDRNNGTTGTVGQQPIHDGGTISVAYNGSVAEAFYQPTPYWACDDVNVLYPRFEMPAEVGLFIATVIRQEKYRFSYGRKWHLERMREARLALPTTPEGKLDIEFMTAFVRSLPFSIMLCKTPNLT